MISCWTNTFVSTAFLLYKNEPEYALPTKLLIEDVLAIGKVSDDHIFQRLKTFYSDTTLVRLIEDVEAKYPELESVEKI